MTRPVLIVDIETMPTDRAFDTPAPEEWLEAPGNYSKPDTIAAYRAKQLAAWPDEISKRASLDWRLGKIAAVGCQIPGMEPFARCSPSEGAMLSDLWTVIAASPTCQLVGFGIAGFDVPWLLGRSAVLRIRPPRRFRVNRFDPVSTDVLDWSDVLSGYGSFERKGWTLARYAEMFGLPAPIGQGKDVAEWMRNGEADKVVEHLTGDLVTTTALDRLFRPAFIA